MNNKQEPKAGMKTTEFWLTLGTAVLGVLMVYGVVNKEQAQAWEAIASALAPALVVAAYSISRALVKK